MHNKQLLSDLRGALKGVKESNQTSIQIEALSDYLDKWEESADGELRETEAQHARKLEAWKAQLVASTDNWLEMFKSVIEAGMTALKSSIVINGGAAATLLALLADALKTNGAGHWGPLLTPLGWAWMCFMCGLGFAGSATGVRYVSQALYAESLRRNESAQVRTFYRRGDFARNVSIFFGFASYVLFFIGAGIIFKVIQSAPTNMP